jgi:hypothetical protein
MASTPQRRVQALSAHLAAAPANANATHALPTVDLDEFRETGLLVLRGLLTEAEVDALAAPIRTAFERNDNDGRDQAKGIYPEPGIYSMGPQILETSPEIAALSCGHPKIVAAVEALFGEPALLAQFWSIMRPAGSGVAADNSAFVPGSGAHFDYKPFRCVGSFVKWMFAVIPFVDYTPSAGPLTAVPGSWKRTVVLPSDGRVHQVDAAQVSARVKHMLPFC